MEDPGKFLKQLTYLEIAEQNSRDKPGQSPYKKTHSAGGHGPPAPPYPQPNYPQQPPGYPHQQFPNGYPNQQQLPPQQNPDSIPLEERPLQFHQVPKELQEKYSDRFQESMDKDVNLEEFQVPENIQSQKPKEKPLTLQEVILSMSSEILELKEEVKRLKTINTTVNRIDKRLAKAYPIETKKKASNPKLDSDGHQ